MSKENVKNILDNKSQYRDKLFCRGFLFTDAEVYEEEFPFYGIWKYEKIDNYNLLVSPKQNYYVYKSDKIKIILVGHAYNPIEMISDEKNILEYLAKAVNEGREAFYQTVNQLTGIFSLIWIYNNKVCFIGDATCMQTMFYGIVDNHLYLSSHTALLEDLLNLEWNPYVKRLVNYRFFPLLGNSLPGNLTPYSDVSRMVPNHVVIVQGNNIKEKRFFTPYKQNVEIEEIVDQVADILSNNMKLIPQKWNNPAISMTGGCDSKTTMACALDEYEKYSYFSYVSSESEEVDAIAAKKIAEALGLNHTTYTIPNSDEEIDDIEIVRTILDHNSGDIIDHNRNDVRKRAYFADTEDFDVEVKSWASEIGRAYYSKRFNGRKNFGKGPSPRRCTTMYKFFLHNRKLVRDTDKVFKKYLKTYFKLDVENPIDWQEQLFWEFRVPSWNGLVITGEHRYSFDITIPYNNRMLLNMLLSVPIEDRITDKAYTDIREKMNPLIDETGVAVQNLKHTKRREKFENLYYILNNMMI